MLAVRAGDREAVVLGGDVDAARLQVLDRVVGAAVAEGQLVGLQTDRPAEQLMTEADAVHGQPADELARTVTEEAFHPVVGGEEQDDRSDVVDLRQLVAHRL